MSPTRIEVAHANLADDSRHVGVRRALAERLDRWIRDTGDPLLHGPVAAPPGAELNLPDQRAPSDPTVTMPRA